jgi:hypothetical protein
MVVEVMVLTQLLLQLLAPLLLVLRDYQRQSAGEVLSITKAQMTWFILLSLR